MYVKLVNPRTGQTFTVQCGKEADYEAAGDMTIDRQREWVRRKEEDGWDARRHAIWPDGGMNDEALRMVEIHIPSLAHKKTAILTNWDAFLVNDQGKTIDRIFRFIERVADIPA